MTYLELLQALEHQLGYQHLPLNPRARTLKDLFECSPVHHELMRQLTQNLYRVNACRTFSDDVTRAACFDAIGAVRLQAFATQNMDVEAVRLLDNLCRALNEILAETASLTSTEPVKSSAEVIQLEPFRRARR